MLVKCFVLFDAPLSLVTVAVFGTILSAAIYILHIDYPINVDVPIVGIGVRYTKWLAAVRNVWFARESINEGYKKYGHFAFQIPTMTRMDIFICNRDMTREYYTLDDDHMSFRAVMSEEFQFEWLLPGKLHNVRRIPNSVIAKALAWQRTKAGKPDDPFFKEFSSEFIHAFHEEMQPFLHDKDKNERGGWSAVPCFPLALKVVARLTTRSLFGEPLCRDIEFLYMCCRFGDAIPRDALILRSCPTWAKSFLARILAAPRLMKKLETTIYTEIKKRRDLRGGNPMKDILDYMMDWADQHCKDGWNDWHITDTMTNTIFAALHTSSQLVVHTLFELATRPEYLTPLRKEVGLCSDRNGLITKRAMDTMYKLDSFIKETQRVNPLDASALARLALKPYTFANGLHIPRGTVIFTPNSPLFEDELFYKDAKHFDGFRFARMRDDPKLKYSCDLTATSEQSMHFGMGRHACPGRFMVSDEVKLALIHILRNFDISMERFGPRPPNIAFGKFMLPDSNVKVWLRESVNNNLL
ncbi:P450 monooxygenase [Biscogniauxia sp. FL1348]|nr:P450 monooxygenase [Biscogniauxia sp. FL1348]